MAVQGIEKYNYLLTAPTDQFDPGRMTSVAPIGDPSSSAMIKAATLRDGNIIVITNMWKNNEERQILSPEDFNRAYRPKIQGFHINNDPQAVPPAPKEPEAIVPVAPSPIDATADQLHENWRQAWQAQNGADTPRWKPLKPDSVEWLESHPGVPSSALRVGENGVQEINIAALPNSQLPPQFSGENVAAAKGAIEAIQANPNATIDELAATVHKQWVERNGSWAAPELKVDYSLLSEAEKAKDRVVVEAAQEALGRTSAPAAQGTQLPAAATIPPSDPASALKKPAPIGDSEGGFINGNATNGKYDSAAMSAKGREIVAEVQNQKVNAPPPLSKTPPIAPEAAAEAATAGAETAEGGSALRRFGPIGLVVAPVFEAGMDGYNAATEGKGAGQVAEAAADRVHRPPF